MTHLWTNENNKIHGKHTEKLFSNRRTRFETTFWFVFFVIIFGWTTAQQWPKEEEVMVYSQPGLLKRTRPSMIEFYGNGDLMMLGNCDLGKTIGGFLILLYIFSETV